jgi:glycine C-acetyltransferase
MKGGRYANRVPHSKRFKKGSGAPSLDHKLTADDRRSHSHRNRLPNGPRGKARIRTIMTSEHTRDQIEQALDILETTAMKLGILG